MLEVLRNGGVAAELGNIRASTSVRVDKERYVKALKLIYDAVEAGTLSQSRIYVCHPSFWYYDKKERNYHYEWNKARITKDADHSDAHDKF